MKLYKVKVRGIIELPMKAESIEDAEKLVLQKCREESIFQKPSVIEVHEYFNCQCATCFTFNALAKL